MPTDLFAARTKRKRPHAHFRADALLLLPGGYFGSFAVSGKRRSSLSRRWHLSPWGASPSILRRCCMFSSAGLCRLFVLFHGHEEFYVITVRSYR